MTRPSSTGPEKPMANSTRSAGSSASRARHRLQLLVHLHEDAASRPCRCCPRSRWSRPSTRPWRLRPGSTTRAASAASCGQVISLFSLLGRHRHDLELRDRLGALAERGADAVGAGVAAADDDDVLVLGRMSLASVIAGGTSPETRRFCCGRKSMAKWMPSRSRPGDFAKKSNGCSEPPASSSASCVSSSSLAETVSPTLTLQWKVTPSASICFTRRSMMPFSILKSGMP